MRGLSTLDQEKGRAYGHGLSFRGHDLRDPRIVDEGIDAPEAAHTGLDQVVPLLAGKDPVGEGATAYLCEGGTCQRPAENLEELRDQLAARPAAAG